MVKTKVTYKLHQLNLKGIITMPLKYVLKNLVLILFIMALVVGLIKSIENYSTNKTLNTCNMTLKLQYGATSTVVKQSEGKVIYEDYLCQVTDQSKLVEIDSIYDVTRGEITTKWMVRAGTKQYFSNSN